MFTPLVDSLRCPNAHADTWLVASIDRSEERDIRAGFLGCPTCLAEYPIRDGVVIFDEAVVRAPFVAPSEAEATRIAAALDLTDQRMTALLHRRWGAHAPLIRSLSPAHLLLVDPPEGVVSGDGISIVLAATAPVASQSMDAVAIDESAGDAMAATLRTALRAGRRMLGPVSVEIPPPLVELARDADVWVAQLDAGAATSAPILPVRRPRTGNR